MTSSEVDLNPDDCFSNCGEFSKSNDECLEQELTDFYSNEKDKKVSIIHKNNPVVLQALRDNEDGDVFLFIDLHQGSYLYDRAAGAWYYWNDHYWREDKLGHVITKVGDVIQLYTDQETFEITHEAKAKAEGNKKAAKAHRNRAEALAKRIKDLKTMKRKKAILSQAIMGKNTLANTGEDWDTKPMLLGCKNGVIDLETGERRDGRPEDYIKRIAPIDWADQYMDCPTWKKFLMDIMGQDAEMVAYLKRLFGYGITGLTTEHIYPIFYGKDGRNGKGTILETLKDILGGMAFKVPASFFMQQVNGKNGTGPDAALMGFRGARIVWSSETNKKDRLDTAKLKEMVGGDTISARPPYGKRLIEFRPTHLLILLTNRLPRVPSDDAALWKRLHIVKFLYTFEDNPDPENPYELLKEKNFAKKFIPEKAGILRWLVEGCLEWQEFGLLPPEKVLFATNEYRSSEDIIGHFIDEMCVTGDPNDYAYRVQPKNLYNAYKEWCSDVGHQPLGKKNFLEDMRERFKTKKNDSLFFVGIALSQVI